ncbi:MAG TPA: PPK2 family polyphosphate kinase [Pseudonocardia sp.]
MGTSVREAFRGVPAGSDLSGIDPRGRPLGPRDKTAAAQSAADLGERLDGLQEALYAEATAGGGRALLLVLQGMDTSGKGGTIRHIGGLVNPQGLHIASFKKPTPEELEHHFLWRIRREVPRPGFIGLFDRSHYEDVLVPRVEGSITQDALRERYDEINAFEAELAGHGVMVMKCMLHISLQEQADRLLARLDDPAKRWKYNPGDLDSRAKWGDYQQAYNDALRHCDSDAAPWYVVPSDRKWYRNWVVAALLAETLAEMDPQFPQPNIDIDAERARIAAGKVS